MLYWEGYSNAKTVETYNFDFNTWQLTWNRIGDFFPESILIPPTPSFLDPIQNTWGDCYLFSAMTSLAQHPDMLNSLFLTPEKSQSGIYAVKLFVRAKPHIVVVDDWMLFRHIFEGASLTTFGFVESERFAKYGP